MVELRLDPFKQDAGRASRGLRPAPSGRRRRAGEDVEDPDDSRNAQEPDPPWNLRRPGVGGQVRRDRVEDRYVAAVGGCESILI